MAGRNERHTSLLSATDPPPDRPHRIVVAGTSGSGKSTLAARIGDVLGIPYVEMDSLYHGAGWVPRPEFASDVDKLIARPAWVTEWQYGPVRDRLADRADLLVWLDLPKALVMAQVVRRTVGRRVRRRRLWNGNVEPPLWTIFTDREHILRWAWNTHHRTGTRVLDALDGRPHLTGVRLRSRADVERRLASLRSP